MDLSKFRTLDIEKLRSMTQDEVFEFHRDRHPVPKGLTYDQVVKRVKFLCKKLEFNPTNEQLHLIMSRGVPLASESCPGSGKTTVSEFIIYCDNLIYGIDPNRMLLTTFSKQGAVSMQIKNIDYAKKLGLDKPIGRMSTMHSWYLSFLEEYFPYVGFPAMVKEITVISEERSNNYLKESYCQITGAKFVGKELIDGLSSLYTFITDSMIMDNEVEIKKLRQFKSLNMDYAVLMQVYKAYTNIKFALGMVDYSDMQVLFLKLLQNNPKVKERIANSFDRVLIDEFQDTSKLQFEIYKNLINENSRKNVLVIGDNDQGIYRWRGTSTTPFEDFFSEYSEGTLVTLGYNMRSGGKIIQHANNLIRHTKNRVDKDMTTPRDIIDEVIIKGCKNRLQAVEFIYSKLEEVYKQNGSNRDVYKQHCVLVRNHNQALWLVDKLLQNKIPVSLTGGKFPYNDKILIDIQNILQMLLNPTNFSVASENLPKLCKDLTASKKADIKIQMQGAGRAVYQCKFSIIRTGKQAERNPVTIDEDLKTIEKLSKKAIEGATVADICRELIPLYFRGSYEYYAKMNNIDSEHYQLIFDYLLEQELTPNAFSLKLNTIREQLEYNIKMDLGFRVGSMHTSKGLEYDTVYLLDCSGLSCPNQSKLEEYTPEMAYDYLEEERNLFYVAITRAIKHLVVTYNKNFPSVFNVESGLIEPSHVRNAQTIPQAVIDYERWKLQKNKSSNMPYSVESTVQGIDNFREEVPQQEEPKQPKQQKQQRQQKQQKQLGVHSTFRIGIQVQLNKEYSQILEKLSI